MSDAYRSAQFKRGIVRENDAANGRSRVELADEDGVSSYWLAWNMPSAGRSKWYSAPDLGSQVNVLVDRHGEDGVILGARYSDEDRPPASDVNIIKGLLEGGFDLSYDKATGTLTIKCPSLILECDALVIAAPVAIEGDTLTHNGTDISDTHVHTGVTPGPANTGPPA